MIHRIRLAANDRAKAGPLDWIRLLVRERNSAQMDTRQTGIDSWGKLNKTSAIPRTSVFPNFGEVIRDRGIGIDQWDSEDPSGALDDQT